jgi:c-di-GMP-binding flagellar brake protein YcgR
VQIFLSFPDTERGEARTNIHAPASEAALKRQKRTDTRRYARFDILEYAIVFAEGQDEPMRSVVVDVGLGGLQTLSRQALSVGQLCQIVIGKGDGSKLNVSSEVRFCRPMREEGLFSIGFRFAPESHEQRASLVDYVHAVFQRQADQLAS